MVTPLARGRLLVQADSAPVVGVDALCGGASGGVLALVPHPDDESLAMGAAIATAARAGRPVAVACVTTGNRSHRSTRCPPDRLARLRRRELRIASAHLGAICVIWLGHDDQRAPPRFDDADSATLRAACGRLGVGAVWTCWRGDPHCDHNAVARAADDFCARAGLPPPVEAPVWGRFIDTAPVAGQLVRLAPSPAAASAKARAIAAHRSQMTGLIPDDPDGFVMDPATQAHFRDSDELFLLPGPP